MARTASPWFWEERNGWYVTKDGQRHFLGGHPPDSPPPRKSKGKWNAPDSIRQRFHALMAAPPPEKAPQPPHSSGGLTLAELFEKCLDWCQKHRSARTYEGYVGHVQAFCDHLKTAAQMPALDLKPFHIIEWLDAHTTWGPTYRRNAITAIQRAFNWAEELGHITTNPIRKMKKPAAKRREHFITPADWEVIRNHYPEGDPFRELLEFAWESGCRPQEARHIETRHVHLDRGVIAIPPEESKGRKKWRVIRLEGRTAEIVAKRLPRATDKLFVNADGNAWTPYAMNCRFCRLQKTLGVKHFAYAFRHGFANRLLVSGADHLTVAELLGHADGTMLARVYQHLDNSDAHLRKALRRANGSGDSEMPKS